MNLIKCYQKNSTWYKYTENNGIPVGVLWHDTGAGNPYIKRYVQPYDGDDNYDEMMSLLGNNIYKNDWNHINREAGVNAWIGKLADESIATVQVGDWDKHAWGCGNGAKGSCNGYVINDDGSQNWVNPFWIQFEICDDGYKDEEYFKKVYKEACEFTAHICRIFNIDPKGTVNFNGIDVPTILCHADSYRLGLGGNHGDVYSWFQRYGYDMSNVREDVEKILNSNPSNGDDNSKHDFGILDVVKLKDGVTTFYNGVQMASWVSKSTLYVRGINNNGTIVISTLKEGAITGVVFASDLILINKHVENSGADVTNPSEDTDYEPQITDDSVEDKKTEDVEDENYINTPAEATNFFIKLLNHIISFIIRLFKK